MSNTNWTNLLLLFFVTELFLGKSAAAGILKWMVVLTAIGLFLKTIAAFATYVIREITGALQEAKSQNRKTLIETVVGIAFGTFAMLLPGYALTLWLRGTPAPLATAIDSYFARVWFCVGAITVLGVGVTSVPRHLSALYRRRSYILPTFRYALWILIRSPLAPFYLSRYWWRGSKAVGDGPIASTASALFGLIFGLFVLAAIIAAIVMLFYVSTSTM